MCIYIYIYIYTLCVCVCLSLSLYLSPSEGRGRERKREEERGREVKREEERGIQREREEERGRVRSRGLITPKQRQRPRKFDPKGTHRLSALPLLTIIKSLYLCLVTCFFRVTFTHAHKHIPVSVQKTLLRKIIHIGILVFRSPNQGLESSFCCWTAGQGLAQKERFLTDTGMYAYFTILYYAMLCYAIINHNMS